MEDVKRTSSLISLMVSVDVKHHIYLLTYVKGVGGRRKTGGGKT